MNKVLLFLMLCSFSVFGQSEYELKNYDYVYKDNIKSVKLYLNGILLSYPIMELKSGQLLLSFDDMNEDVMDYTYSIIHCDKDWTPSDLGEMEYLDGFNGDDIDNYDYSFNTLAEYTHYEVPIPNRDIRLMVSGNYLVHVFEDDGEKVPIITRRFMITESTMRVIPRIVSTSKVSKYRTHQEIDFTVNFKGQEIVNPRKEVAACILQNGRWDNAVMNLQPLFVKPENLIFDYQDKVVFPAGREFRFLDLRSFRYVQEGIADIDRNDDYFDIVADQQSSRANRTYQQYNDINGKFVVEHLEQRNADLRGDYAQVFIALKESYELENKSVYVVGEMTDWQLKEEFKMVYNPAVSSYVTRPLLKQGYYNYYFVTSDDEGKTYDHEDYEGNWHLTENDYTILIYYRPFGQRYDRLVATRTFNSVD